MINDPSEYFRDLGSGVADKIAGKSRLHLRP